MKDTNRLLFKKGHYYYTIWETDILYASADGAYTNIHLLDRKISISKSLKEVELSLNNQSFCRIHHSTLININHINRISKLDDNTVEMTNGQRLILSKSRKKAFLQHFTKV